MIILGIETSHDDSSIAILEDGKVLNMWSISQIDIFKKYGGTIPEIASREHVKNIAILQNFLQEFIDLNKIDHIAYTSEPGLIGCLQVGFLFASALSIALNKPLIKINHLDGHFFSGAIDNKEIKYPALGLIVSGGHSQIIYAKNKFDFQIVGETLDDAIGECYDKVSSRLNLGFPGGPVIDKIHSSYKGKYLKLTKPKTSGEFDFSFSGIKTQVLNAFNNKKYESIEQIAASFQEVAINYLIEKFKIAIDKFKPKSILLGGGVSANKYLREKFKDLHKNTIFPEIKYATDNGAMIAMCAYLRMKKIS